MYCKDTFFDGKKSDKTWYTSCGFNYMKLGGLACCNSRGCKELDTTEQLN